MFNNHKVLDVHSHVYAPIEAYAHLTMMVGANTPMPSVVQSKRLAMSFGWSEDRIVEYMSGHVKLLDQRGIDAQILGPRPFLSMGWMPAHLQPAWTEHVNDLIDLQCRSFPDRFIGACQLPHDVHATDASHCLPELDRCVGELGFVAAYVSPDPDGKRTAPGVHSTWWDPLYARCVDLDIPIIVHGTMNADPRAADIPNNYQLNFLTEQYLAGQFLTRGHVFDRHPQLRVLICHCGGALERFIATDDTHIGQRNLVDNLFYDTCAYDLDFLTAAIRQKGVDSMCFGVETPGSGSAPRADTGRPGDDLVPVIDGFDWLTADDKDKIFHHNPLRFCAGFKQVL
jgi:predicted TIM-barrel fold metal-dependent hydrolase